MVHRKHSRKRAGLVNSTRRIVGRTVSNISRLVTRSVRTIGHTGLGIVKKTDITLRKIIPKERRHTRKRK